MRCPACGNTNAECIIAALESQLAASQREGYYLDSPAAVHEDPSDAPLKPRSDNNSCRPSWAKNVP